VKAIELEVVNFCQHLRRVIRFPDDGMLAILGRNGTGKTNLVRAVRFALTGDNLNVGTKNENIYKGIRDGEKSFVRFVFRHGDAVYTIVRNLKPASPTGPSRLDLRRALRLSEKS
jgi:DNA repair exonuclease SbcCD ATPase subunit